MAKIDTNPEKIAELLSRSVVEVLPSKEKFAEQLQSGRQLKLYIGADATGPALHLGHATNYMILEKFRALGHKVIILIGDFTARIGDPTDKGATRVQLSRAQVIENTKSWLKQLEPIIDINNADNPVEIVYNHDWLSKMTFEDVIGLASNFTVQQMLERDMFEKRLKDNKPIYVHEFFYPLMQGYDSVHLDIDVELCGNDQKFNALTGRTLLSRYRQKEKFVFITTLLENPETGEKMMSKSLGTGVFLDATPIDMYGKIMAQADANVPQLFTDCTILSLSEIEEVMFQLKSGANPKDIKMRLAFEITRMYHGEKGAQEGQDYWVSTFSKKEIPDDIQGFRPSAYDIVTVLVESALVSSKSEARRAIEQGGVRINGESVSDAAAPVAPGSVVQKGKMHFTKVE